MSIECSPAIDRLIREHNKLVHQLRYPEARLLIFEALLSCYEKSPVSLDVAALLDQLAIDCIELENEEEAALYLAHSLAIKTLIFGKDHQETIDACGRLNAQMPDQTSMRREREEGSIRKTLDTFITNLGKSKEEISDQSTVIRCLVIAKKPPEKYFGPICAQAAYTVICEDGQIACLNSFEMTPANELAVGEEIEARRLRLYYGRLWLTYYRKVELSESAKAANSA